MALGPAKDDPNYSAQVRHKQENPDSWGDLAKKAEKDKEELAHGKTEPKTSDKK